MKYISSYGWVEPSPTNDSNQGDMIKKNVGTVFLVNGYLLKSLQWTAKFTCTVIG